MGKLDGQVALITGGTKGIGEAAVRLFVQEGARVVLCGRARQDGERIAAELNGGGEQRAAFFALDVADYENWKQAVSFVKDTFGKLNILINNAGISFRETLAETTPESWERRSQPIRPACITVCSFASLPWQKTAKPALSCPQRRLMA